MQNTTKSVNGDENQSNFNGGVSIEKKRMRKIYHLEEEKRRQMKMYYMILITKWRKNTHNFSSIVVPYKLFMDMTFEFALVEFFFSFDFIGVKRVRAMNKYKILGNIWNVSVFIQYRYDRNFVMLHIINFDWNIHISHQSNKCIILLFK